MAERRDTTQIAGIIIDGDDIKPPVTIEITRCHCERIISQGGKGCLGSKMTGAIAEPHADGGVIPVRHNHIEFAIPVHILDRHRNRDVACPIGDWRIERSVALS